MVPGSCKIAEKRAASVCPDHSGKASTQAGMPTLRHGRGQIQGWPAEGTYLPLQPQARLCTQGNQRRWKGTGQRIRKVTLDPGATADTPVRNQGPGRSLAGLDAGHPPSCGWSRQKIP